MRTNQTLPALGGGFERRIFWCMLFMLKIEKSAKTEKLANNIFANFDVVGCLIDVRNRNKWPAAICF